MKKIEFGMPTLIELDKVAKAYMDTVLAAIEIKKVKGLVESVEFIRERANLLL